MRPKKCEEASALLARRFGPPAEQPVETHVERIRNVAEAVERKVNCSFGKIAAGIGWKTRTFGHFPR